MGQYGGGGAGVTQSVWTGRHAQTRALRAGGVYWCCSLSRGAWAGCRRVVGTTPRPGRGGPHPPPTGRVAAVVASASASSCDVELQQVPTLQPTPLVLCPRWCRPPSSPFPPALPPSPQGGECIEGTCACVCVGCASTHPINVQQHPLSLSPTCSPIALPPPHRCVRRSTVQPVTCEQEVPPSGGRALSVGWCSCCAVDRSTPRACVLVVAGWRPGPDWEAGPRSMPTYNHLAARGLLLLLAAICHLQGPFAGGKGDASCPGRPPPAGQP